MHGTVNTSNRPAAISTLIVTICFWILDCKFNFGNARSMRWLAKAFAGDMFFSKILILISWWHGMQTSTFKRVMYGPLYDGLNFWQRTSIRLPIELPKKYKFESISKFKFSNDDHLFTDIIWQTRANSFFNYYQAKECRPSYIHCGCHKMCLLSKFYFAYTFRTQIPIWARYPFRVLAINLASMNINY